MTVPLNSLFDVTYGNKLDLNKMTLAAKRDGGVNFVGRSSRHHGVSAVISRLPRVKPYPAGCITVALGGTKLLASFVQLEPFYTAQNVAVLQDRAGLSMAEKLYVCLCIRHNRFRYSAFGREANRTIRALQVPGRAEFPSWLASVRMDSLEQGYRASADKTVREGELRPASWQPFCLSDLFDIRKGKRLTKADLSIGKTAFISALDSNNGLRQRIDAEPTHPSGVITVVYNGNGVAEAFFQPEPFFASDDVNVLYPKFQLDEHIGLFICTIIRREKYRFSYGRKWTLDRMNESIIRLPATPNGKLDLEYMRAFISSLPYSGTVRGGIEAEKCCR